MTSLLTTVFAIILVGVLLAAGMSFVDFDAVRASGKIRPTAAHMSNMIEAVGQFREARGSYPLSMEDLRSEIPIRETALFDDEVWVINDTTLCLIVPDTADNRDTLSGVRLHIARVQVSDTCGALDPEGRLFLTYALT